MPGKAGSIADGFIKAAAAMFVVHLAVAGALWFGLDGGQRSEVVRVIRGEAPAKEAEVDTSTAEDKTESGLSKGAELAKRIAESEKSVQEARLELAGLLRRGASGAARQSGPENEQLRARILAGVEGVEYHDMAGRVMDNVTTGDVTGAQDILWALTPGRRGDVLSAIEDPNQRFRRAAKLLEAEGLADMATERRELERRFDERDRYYTSQRMRLMLLADTIKHRETEIKKAREDLVQRLDKESSDRAARTASEASVMRQKTLKLLASMDAEQVAIYLQRQVQEGRLGDAIEIIKTLPDRRAAEVISAIEDPADRKKIIDAMWTADEAEMTKQAGGL